MVNRARATGSTSHWDCRERADLAKTTGYIMRGHNYHVPGDVSGEQLAKSKKADNIDCACRRAHDAGSNQLLRKHVNHDVIVRGSTCTTRRALKHLRTVDNESSRFAYSDKPTAGRHSE